MLSRCFLDFSVGVGAFCHRTESDLFLFSSINIRYLILLEIEMFLFVKKYRYIYNILNNISYAPHILLMTAEVN